MRQVGGPRDGSRESGRSPSPPALEDASPEPRGSISPWLLPPSLLPLLLDAAACCSCCWPLELAAAAPAPPPPSSSTAMLAATLAGRDICTSLPSSDGTGCALWRPRSQEDRAARQPLLCALLPSSATSLLLLVATSPASARGQGRPAAAVSACGPHDQRWRPRRRARQAPALTLLL